MIIDGRKIGPGHPVYIIAEISANHNGDKEKCLELVRLAQASGADAVKLQTYTADTLTINCDKPPFVIEGGLWDKRNLYELYKEAYTPWEWHADIFAEAKRLGITCFSTPFDTTAVDFLEELDAPVHKVASFEIVDIPLLQKIASTGKPVIASTGMASLEEIARAEETLRVHGAGDIALLKCVSSYPAVPADFNVRTIPHLAETFHVISGLSDHSMGHTVAVAAVSLGAHIVEKHFIADRSDGGPDSAFSMEPQEFAEMVQALRDAEQALGSIDYGVGHNESGSITFRRSIFVVEDIAAGEVFTEQNTRIIRPGHGLPPMDYPRVLGRTATAALQRGTALTWDVIGGSV